MFPSSSVSIMTLCVAHRYTLEDFKLIESSMFAKGAMASDPAMFAKGAMASDPAMFANPLSPHVLETLKFIETQIVIPSDDASGESSSSSSALLPFRRPPTTTPHTLGPRRRATGRPTTTARRDGGNEAASIATAKPFIATKRTEVSAVDKQFNDIRALLNKLSAKTVDAQKPVVLDAIAKFLFDVADEGARALFVRKLADILMSNPFLVKVYVEVFTALCLPDFPYCSEFQTILSQTLVEEYMTSLQHLQAVVESSDDYDAFCDYNKTNDKRKAVATFFAEAAKEEATALFDRAKLVSMVQTLLGIVVQSMTESNKVHEVEEVTENIAVLVTTAKLREPQIHACIQELTQKKTKEFPSWSSRALFKYMDLAKIA